MKKIFAVLAIAFALQGCALSRMPNIGKLIQTPEPSTLSMSSMFKLMWDELKTELLNEKSLSNFIPSSDFVKKYSLQQEENSCLVDGYVTVDTQKFNFDLLKNQGVNLVEMSSKEGIYTFTCDVKNLPYLIYADGVKYIEPSRKVNLLNKRENMNLLNK